MPMPAAPDDIEPFPYYRGSAAELPDRPTVAPDASAATGGGFTPTPMGGDWAGAYAGENVGAVGAPPTGQPPQSAGNDAQLQSLLALANKGGGGGGGNAVQNVVGDTAAGASIGSIGGPWGAAIGGGVGLLGGVLGDIFGGGPSESEQVQLAQSKLALAELQRRVQTRDAMVKYMQNPATQANMAAPAQRLQGGQPGEYPPNYQTPVPPPPTLPPPQSGPPAPSYAVPGYQGPTSYPIAPGQEGYTPPRYAGR